MLTSDYVLMLQDAVPQGWAFMYSIRETMLAYEGSFPLMFAEVVPANVSLLAESAILSSYTQSISFFELDEQDSLGINLTDSTQPNYIIQKTKMDSAERAAHAFIFALNQVEDIIITGMRIVPTPRYLWNGGKVLVGVDLTINIATPPERC
jgi:hypothetical protein